MITKIITALEILLKQATKRLVAGPPPLRQVWLRHSSTGMYAVVMLQQLAVTYLPVHIAAWCRLLHEYLVCVNTISFFFVRLNTAGAKLFIACQPRYSKL